MTKAKKWAFKLKIHADEIFQPGGSELAARVGGFPQTICWKD